MESRYILQAIGIDGYTSYFLLDKLANGRIVYTTNKYDEIVMERKVRQRRHEERAAANKPVGV